LAAISDQTQINEGGASRRRQFFGFDVLSKTFIAIVTKKVGDLGIYRFLSLTYLKWRSAYTRI
jgi:hypothetical protein